LRIRNRNEVAWKRIEKEGATRPAPKNSRQERLSQALYDHAPRRPDRLILDTGNGAD
tara:strand:- start:429 stop:599 length:171 start_codon:yes stop_codon:yes gene_type:complete